MPSHLKVDPLGPQRKEKQCLTFIPEEEHAIKYRFEFSVVGSNAKDFADKIIDSDIAEAYRPKTKPGAPEGGQGSNGLEKLPLKGEGATDGNQRVLFHNVGSDISKTELARIRFGTLETFSQSLPVYQDHHHSSHAAVILLYWNGSKDQRPADEQSDILSDRLRDFTSRLAEVNFQKFKPTIFLQAFGADDREQQKIRDWHSQHISKGVLLHLFDNDEEDTLMDAVQFVCEKLLSRDHHVRASSRQSLQNGAGASGSGCCVVS
mmetsp:Transcript_45251/g.82665  ORF Transcript_45251/g.82665 Transcript_45251/m.82665 type:complete len:263 (-) Transcript_45251:104-892(-)